ncbi:MAG: uncharacterized membrane protein YidH (DUF202 family), partial [Flavobacteriales bacterium]
PSNAFCKNKLLTSLFILVCFIYVKSSECKYCRNYSEISKKKRTPRMLISPVTNYVLHLKIIILQYYHK